MRQPTLVGVWLPTKFLLAVKDHFTPNTSHSHFANPACYSADFSPVNTRVVKLLVARKAACLLAAASLISLAYSVRADQGSITMMVLNCARGAAGAHGRKGEACGRADKEHERGAVHAETHAACECGRLAQVKKRCCLAPTCQAKASPCCCPEATPRSSLPPSLTPSLAKRTRFLKLGDVVATALNSTPAPSSLVVSTTRAETWGQRGSQVVVTAGQQSKPQPGPNTTAAPSHSQDSKTKSLHLQARHAPRACSTPV